MCITHVLALEWIAYGRKRAFENDKDCRRSICLIINYNCHYPVIKEGKIGVRRNSDFPSSKQKKPSTICIAHFLIKYITWKNIHNHYCVISTATSSLLSQSIHVSSTASNPTTNMNLKSIYLRKRVSIFSTIHTNVDLDAQSSINRFAHTKQQMTYQHRFILFHYQPE